MYCKAITRISLVYTSITSHNYHFMCVCACVCMWCQNVRFRIKIVLFYSTYSIREVVCLKLKCGKSLWMFGVQCFSQSYFSKSELFSWDINLNELLLDIPTFKCLDQSLLLVNLLPCSDS